MSTSERELNIALRPVAMRAHSAPDLARNRRGLGSWLVLGALLLSLAFVLLPFALVTVNAVKTSADYALHGPLAWPQSFDLSAMWAFWAQVDFTRKLINSFLFSASVAFFAVLISVLAAYAIGIGRVRLGNHLLVFFLVAIMIPQESLVYPLYYLFRSVGLFDSLLSVIIVFTVLSSAFGTYLLSSVLSTFPKELIEAAQIDGANSWQILWRIVVPMLRPTLTVMATFFFIWNWNEFLIPLVMLISNDNQTVSVSLGVLWGQNTTDPTGTAAASLLAILPTVIFFLIFQRTLTRGLVVGAVK